MNEEYMDLLGGPKEDTPQSPYPGMSLEQYQSEILGHQERKKKTALEIYNSMKSKVEDMSLAQKVGTAAKNEVADLWSGIKDVGDVSQGMLGTAIDDDAMWKEAATRMNEREYQREAINEGRKPFEEVVPWYVRGAGAMLPYMVDSALLGPKFIKGAAKGLDLLSEGVKAGATKVGEGGKTLVQMAAELPGNWGKPGQFIQKEVTQPIAKEIARFKKQVPMANPWMDGVASSILGNTALGALESGVNPNENTEDGMLASAIGTAGGHALKPMLHRMPSFYNESEKNLVDWAKQQGYRLLPGAETGHRGMQMFESQLRNAETWTDAINQIDRGNDYVTNRLVFDQLGLPKDTVNNLTQVTPDILKTHMGNLSSEYEDLLAKTKVRIDPTDLKTIRSNASSLDPTIKENKKVVETVNSYTDAMEKLRRSQIPTRDPLTGRMQKGSADTSDFQQLRTSIKSTLNQAYDQKNSLLTSHLEPLLKALDDGVERGARDVGGDVAAAHWKDLNERWALSNLIMEEGMRPNGMVDMDKLGSHFMSNEPKRYLMETAGPRMTELQKAAKFADMSKNYANGGLFNESGQFLKNPQSKSAFQRFVGTTPAAWVPGLRNLYMDLYARGYPSQYGLLGFNGKGLANAPLYTRSYQQATQMYPEILNEGKQKYEEWSTKGKEAGEMVDHYMDLLAD